MIKFSMVLSVNKEGLFMASGPSAGGLLVQALVVLSLLLFKPCAAVVAVGAALYNTLSILFQDFMFFKYGDIRKKNRG